MRKILACLCLFIAMLSFGTVSGTQIPASLQEKSSDSCSLEELAEALISRAMNDLINHNVQDGEKFLSKDFLGTDVMANFINKKGCLDLIATNSLSAFEIVKLKYSSLDKNSLLVEVFGIAKLVDGQSEIVLDSPQMAVFRKEHGHWKWLGWDDLTIYP